jgi:glycosyltransferase involved in cell wall biosynthesis
MSENKKSPLVSVIMIFLNAEKFIQEAIESILSQTYLNWELILVDDGSTDASTEIARQYAQQYLDKIRYVQHANHQNRGMSASRNLGIRQSAGEYIAFLDADDVYLPEKLERQVELLDSQPTAAMVYGTTQYWYSWTGKPEDLSRDSMRTLGVRPDRHYPAPDLVARFLANTARTPATCSVLIRREAIERIGGFEDRFAGMFEDQVFFYKLCLHETVYVESGCWSRYRQHPESHVYVSLHSGSWDPGHHRSPTRAAFLNWLESYVTEQSVSDRKVLQLVKRELRSYRHPQLYFLLSTWDRLKGILKMRVRGLL